jgi:transposase-like protein
MGGNADQELILRQEGTSSNGGQAVYERIAQDQRFKCNSCGSVYEDCYPTDDRCAVCNQGLVRLTGEPVNKHPFGPFDQSAEWKEAIKSEGASGDSGKKLAYAGQTVYVRIKNLSAEAQKSVPLRPVERQPAQLKKLVAMPAASPPSKGLEKG